MSGPPVQRDKRRERGDRTRERVARRAAEVASVEGLVNVSLNRLAADLGVSKSGVAAAYGTKEELQLATVAAAREVFISHVVAPALAHPAGTPRLRALVDAWLEYVGSGVFPGGCFMAAVVPEFDTRPGAVRDALLEARREWIGLLTQEVSVAQRDGELAGLSPEDLAFEIDALLAACNLTRNLSDPTGGVERTRRILYARLGTGRVAP
jgi:AcrR family transcriptional regulator